MGVLEQVAAVWRTGECRTNIEVAERLSMKPKHVAAHTSRLVNDGVIESYGYTDGKQKVYRVRPTQDSTGCKQLMKDGVWQVPPEQRPTGWEKMLICERSEEIRHTITTKETSIVSPEPSPDLEAGPIELDPVIEAVPEPEQPAPEPFAVELGQPIFTAIQQIDEKIKDLECLGELSYDPEAVELIQRVLSQETAVAKPVPSKSYLPKEAPQQEALVNAVIEFMDDELPESLEGDAIRDNACNLTAELAMEVKRYRRNKVLVDEALTGWLNEYSFELDPDTFDYVLAALWETVHGLVTRVEKDTEQRIRKLLDKEID